MSEAPKTLLLLGGTSDIGFAIAGAYARRGWNIVLAVRDVDCGMRNARDLVTRHAAQVEVVEFDACTPPRDEDWIATLGQVPDTAVCVVGSLGDPLLARHEVSHAIDILRANFEGPALLLDQIANAMERRGAGTLVGVSSVAGERGRASNYHYGSSKAGFTAFLSGLRARLARSGVHVLTVKLGFARTRMTRGMTLPPLLTAGADEAGEAVFRAAEITKRNVIYVRPIWRAVMTAIALIPEPIFKKLPL